MKLTIFGASGKTGKILLQKALEGGHEVVAFVRTPSKIDTHHQKLTIIQGDATNPEAVNRAINGADGVISAIGPTPDSPKDLMEKASTNIVAGMNAQGVKRLVWSTGAGVRASQDEPTFLHKTIEFLLKLTAPKVYENALRGAEIIKGSKLDWTIARAPMLTDEPRTNDFRVSYVGSEMGRSLSRQNFALFMLDLVESDQWIHEMPVASDQ